MHSFECPCSQFHCFYECLWFILLMLSIFISKLDWGRLWITALSQCFQLFMDDWLLLSFGVTPLCVCVSVWTVEEASDAPGQASWEFAAVPFISHICFIWFIFLLSCLKFKHIFKWHVLKRQINQSLIFIRAVVRIGVFSHATGQLQRWLGWSACHLHPDWKVSTAIGQFGVQYSAHIHVPLTLNYITWDDRWRGKSMF